MRSVTIERSLSLFDGHAGFEPAHHDKVTRAAAGPDFLDRIVGIFAAFRAERDIGVHIHDRVGAMEFAWSDADHREGMVV
jgi:hypothetical protein